MTLLCYMCSYFLNQKQSVRINNTNNNFLNVISGVSNGSIVGLILFNCFFNDFFTLLKLLILTILQTIHHNTFTTFAKNIQNLIHHLESESSLAIKWLKNNKTIVNPRIFQAIKLDKKKNNHTQEMIKINNKPVNVKSSVKLLGVQTEAELNFSLHIAHICRSTENQLNDLIRLRKFLGFEEERF